MNPNRRIHKDLEVASHQDVHYDGNRSLTVSQLSSEMNNAELAARCEGEIKEFCLGKLVNEKYSIELLHRATLQGDKEAQAFIQQCFHDLVLQWLRLHPQRGLVCKLEKEVYYVNRTFDYFWQSIENRQHTECNSLTDALHIMQTCLNGVILDARRAYCRLQAILVQSEGLPVKVNLNNNAVWNGLQKVLPNGNEQRLAYLLFQCGLKPREIVRFCPHEFSDVHAIYHLHSSMLNRLI